MHLYLTFVCEKKIEERIQCFKYGTGGGEQNKTNSV